MKRIVTMIGILTYATAARCQVVSDQFGNAVTDVQNIAAMVGAAVMGIVGVIGIGRAAYKFSNGEHDSVTALVMGIVALVLGAISATFI